MMGWRAWTVLVPAAMLAWLSAPGRATEVKICEPWPDWPHDEFANADSASRIAVEGADHIVLNGSPTTLENLRRHLAAEGARARPPVTIFLFGDEADCALVQELRRLIAAAMPCARGLCSEVHDVPPYPGAPTGASRAPGQTLTQEEINRVTQAAEEALKDMEEAAREIEREAKAHPAPPPPG
jgi:hypothetical protein